MSSPIILHKSEDKIRIENKFGIHLATISRFDTEFIEPVIETELLAICRVVRDFDLFHENISK